MFEVWSEYQSYLEEPSQSKRFAIFEWLPDAIEYCEKLVIEGRKAFLRAINGNRVNAITEYSKEGLKSW